MKVRSSHAWAVTALALSVQLARAQPNEPDVPQAPVPAVAAGDVASQSEPSQQPATPVVEATLTDAELASLLAQPLPDVSVASERPSLQFYGFGDFMLMKSFPKQRIGLFPPRTVIMTVGNINLYAAADLTHGVSTLLEVRFTYLPNGGIDQASFQPISTNTFDYADWNRPVQWGGIVLERFHLDYSYHGLLNFRLGLWLTPYGIWNVDHGSPTVIPVIKPYVIGEQLFPTRQTGLQVHGSGLLGDVTLGYALTLSNGRGDVQQLDFDKNKALGARLWLSTSGVGNLTLGATGYTGQATRAEGYVVTPGNPPVINISSNDSFKEITFAGDLLWEWRDLRIQSEIVAQQVRYKDDARKLAQGLGTRSGFVPDHVAWGAYVLLAYRLPWLNVMPYFVWDTFDRGYARTQLLVFGGNTVNVMALRGGLNIRPIPSLALKVQYSYIWFPGVDGDYRVPNLSCQAAWAF